MNILINQQNTKGKFLNFIYKYQHFIILLILIAIAFFRNLDAVKGVCYGYYGYDTDRDLGNLNNLIEGNYGKDLSYIGEFMWYNPLITFVQYAVFKITGLSPAYLVVQSGPFINLLCPFVFFFMVTYLFNSRTALASTAALIFFTLGDMNSILSATYSPWNFAGTFSQTILYLAIIIIGKAFEKPGILIFILSGIISGIAFLGHSAPGIILALLCSFLLVNKFILKNLKSLSKKSVVDLFKYGFLFGIPFLIASLPLLYYVLGKYSLHMVNYAPAQWDETGVEFKYLPHLLKQSFSFSLICAIVGLWIFYRNKTIIKGIKRELLMALFLICAILYFYINSVTILRINFGIILPGIVPSFHFIFYLKALQSVFFGVGLCFTLDKLFRWLSEKNGKSTFLSKRNTSVYIPVSVFLITLFYYPVYSKRDDFTYHRAIEREQSSIEMYHWLTKNTDINDVVVSNQSLSLFPVMASGRKLVCSNIFMVNPYVQYENRFNDNQKIMSAIHQGQITEFNGLFKKYFVKYILLENKQMVNAEYIKNSLGTPLYHNDKLSIFKYNQNQ